MDRTLAVETKRNRRLLDSLREVAAAGKRLQERLQFRRLPAGGRDERPIEKGGLAVPKWRSVGAVDQPAGGEQHRVARGRVPLAGRRCPRINVRLAFRDDAEFERRTDRNVAARPDRRFEIVDGCLVEVRLGRDRGERLAALASPDRLAALRLRRARRRRRRSRRGGGRLPARTRRRAWAGRARSTRC